jgi:DNA-binding LacI/PurR family transcriptional regulator
MNGTGNVPRIGLVCGDPPESGSAQELHRYFRELHEQAACVITPLLPIKLSRGARVAWDPEPLDSDRVSPGPLPEVVRAGRFDALICIDIYSDRYLCEIVQLGLPLVTLDFAPIGRTCDSVVFDNQQAGRHVGELLAATGHRHILFASRYTPDPAAHSSAQAQIEDDVSLERRFGVISGLKDSPAELWPAFPSLKGEPTAAYVSRLKRVLAAYERMPDALTGHDVGWVRRVWDILVTFGARRGEISLIGFWAASLSGDNPLELSTMQFSWQEMAETAWRLLRSRLDGSQAPPRTERVPAKYVDRGTVWNRLPPQGSERIFV